MTIEFKNKKPYSLNLLYPAFPFSYRLFCSYWWKDLISLPKNLYRAVKFNYQRLTIGLAESDTWNFDIYNAYIQYKFFSDYKENYSGHPIDLTSEEYKEILNKICNAWKAQIQLLDDYTYAKHCWPDKGYDKKLYEEWRIPLQKQWEEGMQLYIQYYQTFWS